MEETLNILWNEFTGSLNSNVLLNETFWLDLTISLYGPITPELLDSKEFRDIMLNYYTLVNLDVVFSDEVWLSPKDQRECFFWLACDSLTEKWSYLAMHMDEHNLTREQLLEFHDIINLIKKGGNTTLSEAIIQKILLDIN